MSKPVNTLVLIYNSFKDPLFQNLMLVYLKTLSEKVDGTFHLLTFEQEQYKLSKEEIQKEKEHLSQYNITWHPLTFHTGKFLLLKKFYDLTRAFFLVLKLRFFKATRVLFAFANISAAFGIVFSRVLKMKMIIYSYEPHSEFMHELGYWTKQSMQYRILSRFERMAGKHADYILTGTRHMVKELNESGTLGKVFRAPTAVDEQRFRFSEEKRTEIRKRELLTDKKVVSYFGKFGGLYYQDEVINGFAGIYARNPEAFFWVATDYDHLEVKSWFEKEGIPSNAYRVRGRIAMEEMPHYLSASDLGVVAIPPSPAQRFRSPTKVAEYLLCGLPYLVCRGISEDDEYAENSRVGVVVDEFSKQVFEEQYAKMDKLLQEEKKVLMDRCRQSGLAYRSRVTVNDILTSIYHEIGQ